MKKILSVALSLILALGIFVACSSPKEKPQTPSDIGAKASKELTISLNEEEMQKSIKEYVDVLSDVLAENGCVAQLTKKDNGDIAITIVQNAVKGDSQLTQELMQFKNIREAFAYLLYTGQVDEHGKVLAQPVLSNGKEDALQSESNSITQNSDTSSEAANDVSTSSNIDVIGEAPASSLPSSETAKQ